MEKKIVAEAPCLKDLIPKLKKDKTYGITFNVFIGKYYLIDYNEVGGFHEDIFSQNKTFRYGGQTYLEYTKIKRLDIDDLLYQYGWKWLFLKSSCPEIIIKQKEEDD